MAGFRAQAAVDTAVEHGLDLTAEIVFYRLSHASDLLISFDDLTSRVIHLLITNVDLFTVLSHIFLEPNKKISDQVFRWQPPHVVGPLLRLSDLI